MRRRGHVMADRCVSRIPPNKICIRGVAYATTTGAIACFSQVQPDLPQLIVGDGVVGKSTNRQPARRIDDFGDDSSQPPGDTISSSSSPGAPKNCDLTSIEHTSTGDRRPVPRETRHS